MRAVVLSLLALMSTRAAVAQSGPQPYQLVDLVQLFEARVSVARILAIAAEHCLGFSWTSDNESALSRAGASSQALARLKQVCFVTAPARAAIGTASAAPTTVAPGASPGSPSYFRFDEFGSDPHKAGPHIWNRSGETWTEYLPDGSYATMSITGHVIVSGDNGTVARKIIPSSSSLQIPYEYFIPDKGSAAMWLRRRAPDAPWEFVQKMQDVK